MRNSIPKRRTRACEGEIACGDDRMRRRSSGCPCAAGAKIDQVIERLSVPDELAIRGSIRR